MGSKKVMGVDCSSKSFAFSLFKGEKLFYYGEVFFDDITLDPRMGAANDKMRAVRKLFGEVDEIYYESPVYIQNKQTVIALSMMLGAALSPFLNEKTKTFRTHPIVWQRDMNPALTKFEKDKIKSAHKDKSASWVKEAIRKEHKARSIKKANDMFGTSVTSDNVSDAILIGAFGAEFGAD